MATWCRAAFHETVSAAFETGNAGTALFEWLMIALLLNSCSDRDVPDMLKMLKFRPGPDVTASAASPLDPLRYSSGVRRRTTVLRLAAAMAAAAITLVACTTGPVDGRTLARDAAALTAKRRSEEHTSEL